MSRIVRFAVASAMREGEIARIDWVDLEADKRVHYLQIAMSHVAGPGSATLVGVARGEAPCRPQAIPSALTQSYPRVPPAIFCPGPRHHGSSSRGVLQGEARIRVLGSLPTHGGGPGATVHDHRATGGGKDGP